MTFNQKAAGNYFAGIEEYAKDLTNELVECQYGDANWGRVEKLALEARAYLDELAKFAREAKSDEGQKASRLRSL